MNPQRFIVESPPITTSCWTFIVTEYLTSVLHRREKSTVTFNTDTDSKYSTPNIEYTRYIFLLSACHQVMALWNSEHTYKVNKDFNINSK